jgi:hypothetical protein
MRQLLQIKFLFGMLALGLMSCFLPAAQFRLADTIYITRIMDDYSGWGTFFLLLTGGTYSLWKWYRKHPPSHFLIGFIGIYLIGFVFFRTFHLFAVFSSKSTDSLAHHLQASGFVREGLILLAISGIGMLVYALKIRKVIFQP